MILIGKAVGNHVKLEVRESLGEALPRSGDVSADISVTADGFSGSSADTWIAAEQWSAFTAELRNLMTGRQGSAELVGVSPAELSIKLRSVGRLSDVHVSGHIAVVRYVFGSAEQILLTFAFESALDEIRMT